MEPACLARFPPTFVDFTFPVGRTSVLDVTCEITSYFIVIYIVHLQIAPIGTMANDIFFLIKQLSAILNNVYAPPMRELKMIYSTSSISMMRLDEYYEIRA